MPRPHGGRTRRRDLHEVRRQRRSHSLDVWAAWSVTRGVTFDPAAPSTAELTAIALSVMLLLAGWLRWTPPTRHCWRKFGTRTRDVAVYDVGRESIRPSVSAHRPEHRQQRSSAGGARATALAAYPTSAQTIERPPRRRDRGPCTRNEGVTGTTSDTSGAGSRGPGPEVDRPTVVVEPSRFLAPTGRPSGRPPKPTHSSPLCCWLNRCWLNQPGFASGFGIQGRIIPVGSGRDVRVGQVRGKLRSIVEVELAIEAAYVVADGLLDRVAVVERSLRCWHLAPLCGARPTPVASNGRKDLHPGPIGPPRYREPDHPDGRKQPRPWLLPGMCPSRERQRHPRAWRSGRASPDWTSRPGSWWLGTPKQATE